MNQQEDPEKNGLVPLKTNKNIPLKQWLEDELFPFEMASF